MRRSPFLICGVLLAGLSCKNSTTGVTKQDIQLVPKETNTVLMANLAQMRNTSMWRKLLDVRDGDTSTKKDYDDFVQRCGLDPFKDIDSVFVAFPQGASDTHEFAVLLRGRFNEQKLVQCAKDQAKKDGSELINSEYGGKKLYSQQSQAFATFLDGKTVAMGGKEWIKKVIDLAATKDLKASANDNAPLVALSKQVKSSNALWGAGIVPQSARDSFKNDAQLSAAASMTGVFGSIDFSKGMAAELNVETASANDSKELAAKATTQLAETRKNPQMMMMGLSSFLDGVNITSQGNTFHLTVEYNQQQMDDLISRIKGLLKSFGSMAAQGTLPGGPAAPAAPQSTPK